MRLSLLLLLFFAFFLKTNAQQIYYTVKFPDDATVYGCGVTADTVIERVLTLVPAPRLEMAVETSA